MTDYSDDPYFGDIPDQSNEPSYSHLNMAYNMNMMPYRRINNEIESCYRRQINNEINSCYTRFVAFDNHYNRNNDTDQGDISQRESVLYGLATQERKEKGTDSQNTTPVRK